MSVRELTSEELDDLTGDDDHDGTRCWAEDCDDEHRLSHGRSEMRLVPEVGIQLYVPVLIDETLEMGEIGEALGYASRLRDFFVGAAEALEKVKAEAEAV